MPEKKRKTRAHKEGTMQPKGRDLTVGTRSGEPGQEKETIELDQPPIVQRTL
jgi:hypothetical protein